MILFGVKRRWAPLNEELKNVSEETMKKAIERLSFNERQVALWYFGFENKGLSKPEITEKLGVGHDYMTTLQARVRTRIYSDIFKKSLPKNKSGHGNIVRYHENKIDKVAIKKELLQCKDTKVWEKITKKQQIALSLFYCLDENGDQIIFGREVAKKMGVNRTRACALVRRGKERLAKYHLALRQFLPPKSRKKTESKTKEDLLKIKIPSGRYKGLRIDEFLQKIASTAGITRAELVQKLRGKGNEDIALIRQLAISILAKTSLPRTQIAEVFGCTSPGAVNHAVNRTKKILS
ncbi:MAG: hypothetical protein Q7R75_00730 [bacterium]|nr:hypothetical protein [bacterium]